MQNQYLILTDSLREKKKLIIQKNDIINSLQEFGLTNLTKVPVCSIENLAVNIDNTWRGVCARKCIGCSSGAVDPSKTKQQIHELNPNLLKSLLEVAKVLANEGYHILSKNRFSLFDGSNELENQHCLELRALMSTYYEDTYGLNGFGAISSDLVFHITPHKTFKHNLSALLERPEWFDNICVAIDEQTPFNSEYEYQKYLDTVEWVWKELLPALCCELEHAKSEKSFTPRVIINFLIPGSGRFFNEKYKELLPGIERAKTYKELEQRYVEPYVGSIQRVQDNIPNHHVFTNFVAKLSKVKGSRVYISYSEFEPVGRARSLINSNSWDYPNLYLQPTIKTKIYPSDKHSFVVQSCLSPNCYSNGELSWELCNKPEWLKSIETIEFNLENIIEASSD
ncbi:MAG: hypothetical protein JEZ14_12305 [Marinilabiliaceae bacterium]|nr:hypothetical protein [Marinilabiliaceae bacterium]